MAAKHSTAGMLEMLDNYLNTFLAASGARIGLFAMDLIPDYDLDSANYLSGPGVPTFDGYAEQNLTGWSPAMQDVEHVRATAATYTFTVTVGGTVNSIYGYYIVNVAGTDVLIAERDPAAPVSIGATAGQTYKVTPNISVVNE